MCDDCAQCGLYKHFCPIYAEHHQEITFEENDHMLEALDALERGDIIINKGVKNVE